MRAARGRAIRGPARPGRRTKHLIPELHAGDIAVIDHPDLDPVCAEGLIQRRVAAVVNAAESLTGRYPASGPGLLLAAGIPVFDSAGEALLDALAPVTPIELRPNGEIVRDGERIAAAAPLTPARLDERLAEARERVATEMEAFVQNTLSYLSQEWPLLFDESTLPELRTSISGRHVLIVVRGEGFREDLQAVRHYVDGMHPVLIAVDGGADALLEIGLRPDIILGDMDSVSDAALRSGAELLVHGYRRDGGAPPPGADAPGLVRVQKLGLQAKVLHAVGMSEDVAMILAERKGARLIVLVGAHFSLQDFLDKGRKGMSSTFLARLKVGSVLVDAKGVSRLYRRGLRPRDALWIAFLVFAALSVVLAMAQTDAVQTLWDFVSLRVRLWLRRL